MTRQPTWKEQQARADLAARKRTDEENRDPVLEQCLIAYVNHRKDGGSMKWDDWRPQWMRQHGAAAEKQMKEAKSS
jgi:adenosyl cobinamide kinase/adenosyl cobinamide phosphate guanylyltransferase